MMLGVVSFSFATGALASILTSYDSKEAQLKERIATLNQISNEYDIDVELYTKLVRTMKYDHHKKSKDTSQFMEELPPQLKLDLAMAMHQSMYQQVNFFKNKDRNFLQWVTRLVKTMTFQEQDYIYKEGEPIVEGKLDICCFFTFS